MRSQAGEWRNPQHSRDYCLADDSQLKKGARQKAIGQIEADLADLLPEGRAKNPDSSPGQPSARIVGTRLTLISLHKFAEGTG